MKSRHVLTAAAFLPVLALSAPARAQAPHRTFTAFGPQTFQRAAGPPDTFSRSFAVRNPNTTFTLRVHNDRVSSATITLNGVDVVRPSDFNRTVTLIERPVSLQATNQLLVTLRSAPGSSLTIDILGVDDDLPQITAALTPRPNAGGWNNADVTVSFSCGDLTSGIASCPSPSVVSQEGAGQTVGGRAVDLAGNVATTRVVVNLDKTAPIVRMSSPVDQSTVRFPALTASATIADTLSGLATATCNGRPVAVAGGTLSCNLTLVSGPNTIVVEAADLAGNVGRSSVGVTFVPNHPPIANAGGPYSGEEGLPTAFDGSQSTDADSDALTFAWDFGDGTTGSGPAPSHLYATTGTFNVTLTVSDDFGGSATASTMATVVSSRPRITGFTPTSAPPGGLVTVSGSNFISAANAGPQVTLARQGGGTIAAPLVSFTSTSIVFIVPAGAATGAIRVTVEGRDGASPDTFAVAASTTFSLRALPASANVIRGQSVNYALTLNTPNGFSQLAALAVSGLPAGLAASIAPQNISVGQTSVLTISTQIGQPTGPSTFSVTASALVEGVSVADTATLTVNVQPVTTTFLGRAVVDDAVQTPLAGVTVSMLGRDGTGRSTGCVGQTISDAAGNFALTNLASNCAGSQLIRYNGLTATSPPGLYAGVDLAYTIAANQVTVSQVLIHLPRLDAGETVMVQQNAAFDQVFAFKTIPNLSVRIYAGTTFTLVDGTRPNPFPLMAIEVPIDRLPDEMPPMPDAIGAFIVAFQPANTKASQPVAVTFPNRLQTLPGTSVELTTLDPTKGVMVMYGTGVVSNDALQIIPDLDPARPGKRYGLVNFDWHGPITQPPPPRIGPGGPSSGGSVDLASGIEVFSHADIALRGARGSIVVERTYRTRSDLPGPFGIGTSHNYFYRLDNNAPASAVVVGLILPNGNRIPFTRQPDGTLINQDTPSMRGVVMTAAAGQPPHVRFRDGTIFRFRWGAITVGLVLNEIQDPNGNVTTINYIDNVGTVGDITDPVGRKLVFAYDAANRVGSITDPIGRAVRYTYHATGRLATMTDPENGVTRYDYNARNQLSRVVDPRGVTVIQNTYDGDERVSEQITADGGRKTFEYTLANPLAPTSPILVTVVTDARGNKSSYRFSPQGYLLHVTDPTGQTTTFERELGTNLLLAQHGTAVCDACGSPALGDVSYTYDERGNPLTQTDALGNITQVTYEPTFNQVATFTDAAGHATEFKYDTHGNLVTFKNARGHATTFTYDNLGQLTAIADPAGQTTRMAYDGLGNLVAAYDALGNVTVNRYDAVSRLVEQQDPAGGTTQYTYDRLDRPSTITDALGRTVTFTYDEAGDLLSIADARHNTTTFTIDPMRRVATRTDPLGRMTTYHYDLGGNLSAIVDRRGLSLTFAYDALNRPVLETYPDATVARAYDARGRLVHVVDSQGGAFDFSWDAVGNLLKAATPAGAVTYTRDPIGRTVSRAVAGHLTAELTYDEIGNMTRAALPQAWVAMSYDGRDLREVLTRSNGVSTSFAYDAVGRLLSRTHRNASSVLDAQQYTYDALGRRTSATTALAQPLTTAPAAGEVDAANQLQHLGSRAYTYDELGNRTRETGPDGTTTYTWDGRHRLQRVSLPDGRSIDFTYDFNGFLIRTHTIGSGVDVTQDFVLDEHTNIATESTNGAYTSALTGQGLDSYFAVVDAAGQPHFALTGTLGSVVAHTDATGAVTGRAYYEPYGQTTATGAPYPFEYGGHPRVAANLYYFRQRFYDPIAGRFISEDPSGLLGGFNAHQYAQSDPVNKIDPLGLWTGVDDGMFAAGGAIAGVAGQAISDAISGQMSGWEDYAAAALGGAVTGEALLYTGPLGLSGVALASAAGGAAGNLAKQGLKNLTGAGCGFDAGSLATDTATAGALGYLPAAIKQGVTAGTGSLKSTFNRMATQLSNGTISNVSMRTAARMFQGRAADAALPESTLLGGIASGVGRSSGGGDGGSRPCK